MRKIIVAIMVVVSILAFPALSEEVPWDCPNCGRTGNTGNFCGTCGTAASEAVKEGKTVSISIQIGDYITFGQYEQDNNLNNGLEPIEWLVLDVQDDQALLISRYILETQAYNTRTASVTWKSCTLRGWLNNVFINQAFRSEEKKAICTVTVKNGEGQGYSAYKSDGGKDTEDRIFLLSYAELNNYFKTQRDQIGLLTEYATKKGNAAWWWLRSIGLNNYYAAFVNIDGSISNTNVSVQDGGVRPALWVDLGSMARGTGK